MAKLKKYKEVVNKAFKQGLKKDGTPKKEYQKGDSIWLTEKESKNYKKLNYIK